MSEWLAAAYPWVKALHIVSVVAWMAGLLYLPRLFVYHAEAPTGSNRSETFKIMERRLLHGIMLPAAIATVFFGVLLASTPGTVDWHRGWMWAKLLFVLALGGFHLQLAAWHRQFVADRRTRSSRFFRIANEAPTVALIAIVVLVVVKPF
jgi:putative membrane protein